MIRIVREIGPKGFVSVRALGHAEYSVRGKDVVCAAASALLQAWLRNLIELLGDRLHVELDRKAGRMVFIVPQDLEADKRQAVEQLAVYFYPSILSIAEQYPENILVSEIGASGEAVCNASATK
ncbi:ribosomal-processing cysteine protease Prp [bacterium]|nr:ribosomal-processing cysteine protease Prp [bacterium]